MRTRTYPRFGAVLLLVAVLTLLAALPVLAASPDVELEPAPSRTGGEPCEKGLSAFGSFQQLCTGIPGDPYWRW